VDLESLELVWSKEYKLPLVPQHNNPWIYCAYIIEIMRRHDLLIHPECLMAYYRKCTVKPGLVNRWPGSGGVTSHDELIGLASVMGPKQCLEVLNYLDRNFGYYNNIQPKPKSIKEFFRYNLYRMPYLRSYLSARSNRIVFPLGFFFFCALVLIDCLFGKDSGGHLRVWIMLTHLSKKHWTAKILFKIFDTVLNVRQITLNKCLGDELPMLKIKGKENWRRVT